MKIGNFKRIFKTDYETQFQNMIDRLSVSLNAGIETLYDALNKKLSLRDNILCTVKDVDVEVGSDGVPSVPVGISLDGSGRVDGITVFRVDNLTTSGITPTGQPFISFTQRDNSLIFNKITGLQSGYQWRLRLVAWQY